MWWVEAEWSSSKSDSEENGEKQFNSPNIRILAIAASETREQSPRSKLINLALKYLWHMDLQFM